MAYAWLAFYLIRYFFGSSMCSGKNFKLLLFDLQKLLHVRAFLNKLKYLQLPKFLLVNSQ